MEGRKIKLLLTKLKMGKLFNRRSLLKKARENILRAFIFVSAPLLLSGLAKQS
jgi:hypothetical protein